jgi:hypothetical protein
MLFRLLVWTHIVAACFWVGGFSSLRSCFVAVALVRGW